MSETDNKIPGPEDSEEIEILDDTELPEKEETDPVPELSEEEETDPVPELPEAEETDPVPKIQEEEKLPETEAEEQTKEDQTEEEQERAPEEEIGPSGPRSRRKMPSAVSGKKILAGVVTLAVVLAGAGIGYYVYESGRYKTSFFPNTMVNGVDASQKTVEQVKELVSADVENYTLTIRGRGGLTDTITNDEIGLHMEFDGSLEQYLAAQKPMDWWRHRKAATDYQIATAISMDEQMLSDRIDRLVFFDESQVELPQNAYLSDYIEGEGFTVIPEELGNQADRTAVASAVAEAVGSLQPELNLDELDVYVKPEITSDNADLNAQAEGLNKYVKTVITYRFGEQEEVLNGDRIVQWLTEGEDGGVTIDSAQVEAYVKELAEKYDTSGKPKTFTTTGGETVTIEKGNYGWKIDQKQEAGQLYELLMNSSSQDREPVYAQTANSRGENDYGNTYVEVNLTAQHLYYYVDGSLVVESDLVSGNHSRGLDTPTGAYPIAYKQRNRVLRGQRRPDGSYEYESPVSYWMPFNGGVGLHDATWRGAFGGKIYLTNGSHGCVNLPKSVAKTIYESITVGTPVLCFQTTGGTETTAKKTTAASSSKTTSKPAAQTQPAPAPAPAPQPVPETTPAPAPEPETVPETAAPDFSGGPGVVGLNPNTPSPAPESSAAEPGGGSEAGGPAVPAPEGPGAAAGPGAGGGDISGSSGAGSGDVSGGPGAVPAPAAPDPSAESVAPAGPGEM